MGGGDLLVSGLISYSLAWPERWPGEGDKPLLAQRLAKLLAISSCLFFSLEDGRSSMPQPESGGWLGPVQMCAESHRAVKSPPHSPGSAQS